MLNFFDSITSGKPGENIFKEDFLDFLNINYIDVTECHKFQIIDSDFISKIGLYEIKANYKDDKKIIIEEYTNINENLGKVSYGWFYKSKSDLIIFISLKTRTMIFIPFTDSFKKFYKDISKKIELKYNKFSFNPKTKTKWQSAFKIINLDDIKGFFSVYKKVI